LSTSRIVFVAGTDTGVGKTTVAAGLLRAIARSCRQAQAFKPVATGCTWEAGRLVSDDARALQREAGLALSDADSNPAALEPAIAPHLAAARAEMGLSVAALAAHCRSRIHEQADLVLVEGAGGWLVPLNRTETLADLCERLEAAVVLVVGMRLGCLNHALLTAADVARRGLTLAGWVACCIDPGMLELRGNLCSLEERLPAPCLGTIPWAPEDPIEAAARNLDPSPLFALVEAAARGSGSVA
jgi:dethiobiotin synthetase